MNGLKYIVMVNNGTTIDSAFIDTSTVYLRAYAYYGTSRASFAYSIDNQSFTKLGNDLSMQFNWQTIFTGNKFCLFNYATKTSGGFVDFDWFRTYVGTPTEVIPNEDHSLNNVPREYFLGQNYPNPFNPSTIISYQLPVTSNTNLKVYNLLGEEVATLFEGIQQPGKYEAIFNGSKLASGMYVYRLSANIFVDVKKLVLLK